MKFKVGDIVEVKDEGDYPDSLGRRSGRVANIYNEETVGITFPGWDGGHNLDGLLKGSESGSGRYIHVDHLKKISGGDKYLEAIDESIAYWQGLREKHLEEKVMLVEPLVVEEPPMTEPVDEDDEEGMDESIGSEDVRRISRLLRRV